MKNATLVCYGAVTKNFKGIAHLKKLMNKVKNGEINQYRVDCYKIPIPNIEIIEIKFIEIGIGMPENVEIFYPSDKYPSHVDDGGVSYFIPLETGNFYIDGINHSVVPFVLYAFDDAKLHNTDFCAIMLK